MVRNQNEVLNLVNKYLHLLEQNGINIFRAYLFGSYAQQNAREDSDIDVAIISNAFTGDRVEDTVRLKLLTEKVNLDIWPHPYLPEELDRAQNGSFLKEEIIDKGIPIQ